MPAENGSLAVSPQEASASPAPVTSNKVVTRTGLLMAWRSNRIVKPVGGREVSNSAYPAGKTASNLAAISSVAGNNIRLRKKIDLR